MPIDKNGNLVPPFIDEERLTWIRNQRKSINKKSIHPAGYEVSAHIDFLLKYIDSNESINELKDLVIHCYVHSAYERCGYKQMTTKQKQMFDHLIEHMNDEETPS